ncbi:hypothetical protein D3C86_1570060 [compost metagenome]
MTWNLVDRPLVPVGPVDVVFTPSTYTACAPEAASRVSTTWCQLPSFTALCERVPAWSPTDSLMLPVLSSQPQNTSSTPGDWSRPKMPGAVHELAPPACVVFM